MNKHTIFETERLFLKPTNIEDSALVLEILNTPKWIRYIGERDQIDVRLGLKQYIKKYGPTKGFDFQEDAFYGKVRGLLTHTNVRKDKWDCYPHPDLVDMIMSL